MGKGAGSGCSRWPGPVPFGSRGFPGGWRRREPARLRAVCAVGVDALPGSAVLTSASAGVFPAGDARRGFLGQLPKRVQAAVLVQKMEKHPVFCNVISSSL